MLKVLGYGAAGGLLGAVAGGLLIGLWGWYQDKTNPTGWGAVFTVAFALLGMVGGGALGAVVGGIMGVRKGGKRRNRGSGEGAGRTRRAKATPRPKAARSRRGR